MISSSESLSDDDSPALRLPANWGRVPLPLLTCGPWRDEEFEPTTSSLGTNLCKRYSGQLVWRLGSTLFPEEEFRVDAVNQGCFRTAGILGGLAWIAAAGLLGATVGQGEPGQFCFLFFHDGQWQRIDVDEWLPCLPSGPAGAAGVRGSSSMLVSLYEKAFAKLAGSYERAEGAHIDDVMVALTGGLAHTYSLQGFAAMAEEDVFQRLLMMLSNCLLACSTTRHAVTVRGVLPYHAYSVAKAVQYRGEQFVQICNPWGVELEEMVGEDALPLPRNPGRTWLTFTEFQSLFTHLHVCSLLSSHFWYCFEGQWCARTAGGGPSTRQWSTNPQLSLHVPEDCEIALRVQRHGASRAVLGLALFARPPNGRVRKYFDPVVHEVSTHTEVSVIGKFKRGRFVLVAYNEAPGCFGSYSVDIAADVKLKVTPVSGNWRRLSTRSDMEYEGDLVKLPQSTPPPTVVLASQHRSLYPDAGGCHQDLRVAVAVAREDGCCEPCVIL